MAGSQTLRWSAYLGAAVQLAVFGLLALLLLPVLIVALALIVVWVGLPLLAITLRLVRGLAMRYRHLAGRLLGGPVRPPYRALPAGIGAVERLRLRLADPTTYRDMLWLPLAACVGFPLGLVAMIFYIVFPLGVLASPIMVRTFTTLAASILRRADAETEAQVMAERIGALTQSRAETVDAQAAELRRIERDLHDGAQARLVSLSLNLGLAEQLLNQDPDASRDLIAESRRSAGVALSDLRGLVRGILPPVLADRGLTGAIEALALNHPVDVDIDLDLPGRPAAPVESALYFAVAEALVNSAKHAAARRAWVWGRYTDGRIRINVGDDGVGGALVSPDGGLAGIERRLAAFDGSLSVASPLARGTILSMELPCESFSART